MVLQVSIPDRVLGVFRRELSTFLIHRQSQVSIPDRVLGVFRRSGAVAIGASVVFQSLIGF
mgnify:CR=1 FL=1